MQWNIGSISFKTNIACFSTHVGYREKRSYDTTGHVEEEEVRKKGIELMGGEYNQGALHACMQES